MLWSCLLSFSLHASLEGVIQPSLHVALFLRCHEAPGSLVSTRDKGRDCCAAYARSTGSGIAQTREPCDLTIAGRGAQGRGKNCLTPSSKHAEGGGGEEVAEQQGVGWRHPTPSNERAKRRRGNKEVEQQGLATK